MNINLSTKDLKSLESTIEALKSFDKNVSLLCKDAANAIAEHVAERAVENAPIWENRLRPAIKAEKARRHPTGFMSRVSVSDKIVYANIMHAELQPFGSGPYNLGPISRTMPMTSEGGVGGMFITRVVDHHADRYQSHIYDVLGHLIATGERKTFSFDI
jgi:hypothetical protein